KCCDQICDPIVHAVRSLPCMLQKYGIGLERKARESLDVGRLLHVYAAPFRGTRTTSEVSLAAQPAQGGKAPERRQVERAEALGKGDRECRRLIDSHRDEGSREARLCGSDTSGHRDQARENG